MPTYTSLSNWALEETTNPVRKESGFTAELRFWPLGSKLNREGGRVRASGVQSWGFLAFPVLGSDFALRGWQLVVWLTRRLPSLSAQASLWGGSSSLGMWPVSGDGSWFLSLFELLVPAKITVESQSRASSWQQGWVGMDARVVQAAFPCLLLSIFLPGWQRLITNIEIRSFPSSGTSVKNRPPGFWWIK